MKIIKYFFEFLIVISLFIIFKIMGLKYASNIGSLIGKIFGPDDNDALKLISKFIEIRFITADKRGLPISRKRICEDMGYELDLVSSFERLEWINKKYKFEEVIYMGDGIFDRKIMSKVGYSIAPSNSDAGTKKQANYVTINSVI